MNLKHLLIVAFLATLVSANAQTDYPQDYFRKPLDIPLVLAGTFGELRSNHFHSGLDLKTQQREGFKVYAIADGYISRIKYKRWGYGKAIYIKHPNGYTSVYAHLQKTNSYIEAFIKKRQYKNKNYDLDISLGPDELPVSKGQIIAFTGTTGGVGPHLHFEIRSAGQKPTNPFLFGIKVADTKNPSINVLVGYPTTNFSFINGSNTPVEISFTRQRNGDLLANTVTAQGEISFGVNAFDRQNNALNKNGLYSLEMRVNGQEIYKHKVEKFSFAESKYINLLIDYKRFKTLKQRVQKCYITPQNKLSIYTSKVNNGTIYIEDGMTYNVEIIAKDFHGNQTKLIIPVVGLTDNALVQTEDKITAFYLKAAEFNKFSENGVSIAFAKNTAYKDLYLDFYATDSTAHVHTDIDPLRKPYTLTFDVSKYTSEEKKQLFIAKKNSYGNYNFITTNKKETSFYTRTKYFGDYALKSDKVKPKVFAHNFKKDQWLSKYRYLKLKVSDDFSGIDSYTASIDGQWILLEYDTRKKILVYDFSDQIFTGTRHTLKVIVKDNAGNTKVYNTTFYRK